MSETMQFCIARGKFLWRKFGMTISQSERVKREMPHPLPLAPHILFFLIYNLCYFLPLFAVFIWGYSEGGSEDIVGMGKSTMLNISVLYATGICAFFLGAKLRGFLAWSIKKNTKAIWDPIWFRVSLAEKLIIAIMLCVFLATKIALIPTGVYREYAFDASLMDGPVWNFSMFCSETMVLLGIIVLFSKSRHNVFMFFLISTANAANLLHGTRIFAISTIMSLIAYAYVRGLLSFRRVALYGPPVFVAVLCLTYLVYLSRSSASFAGAFSPAKILSPIMYESMFSQLSLIGTVNSPSVWNLTGHIPRFLSDLFLFVSPRIIIPDKDSLLYLRQFDYLSPKGAFNGYAIGLIYLGIFSPLFYFFLGFLGDWLYASSKKSAWWFVSYIFYTADFLLHIMRDGYLIPIKMLINTTQWVGVFIAFRWLLKMIDQARDSPV